MLTMAASIDVVSDSDSDLVERAASTYAGILPYCAECLPVQGEDGESRRDSGSMSLSRLIRSVLCSMYRGAHGNSRLWRYEQRLRARPRNPLKRFRLLLGLERRRNLRPSGRGGCQATKNVIGV